MKEIYKRGLTAMLMKCYAQTDRQTDKVCLFVVQSNRVFKCIGTTIPVFRYRGVFFAFQHLYKDVLMIVMIQAFEWIILIKNILDKNYIIKMR